MWDGHIVNQAQFKPLLRPLAPNLLVVVRRLAFSEQYIRNELAAGHGKIDHPGAAAHPPLTADQIGDVAGYFMSLRPAE